MYSSKIRVILLPVKFVANNLGDAVTRTGASESLGPPVGAPICAQPVPVMLMIYANKSTAEK